MHWPWNKYLSWDGGTGYGQVTNIYRSLFHKTLWIRKLRICNYGQILTVNLLVNCQNSVIYGHFVVNYLEKSFMEQAPGLRGLFHKPLRIRKLCIFIYSQIWTIHLHKGRLLKFCNLSPNDCNYKLQRKKFDEIGPDRRQTDEKWRQNFEIKRSVLII